MGKHPWRSIVTEGPLVKQSQVRGMAVASDSQGAQPQFPHSRATRGDCTAAEKPWYLPALAGAKAWLREPGLCQGAQHVVPPPGPG